MTTTQRTDEFLALGYELSEAIALAVSAATVPAQCPWHEVRLADGTSRIGR